MVTAAAQSPDLTTAAPEPARSPSLAAAMSDGQRLAQIASACDPQLVLLFASMTFLFIVLCSRNPAALCPWRFQRRRESTAADARAAASDLEAPSIFNSAYSCGHGLSKAMIKALPTARFSKGTAAAGNPECAVCLTEFEDGDELRTLPLCGHAFHAECIDRWLHSQATCPLCRAAVRSFPPLYSGRIRQFPADILFIDAAWTLPHRPTSIEPP